MIDQVNNPKGVVVRDVDAERRRLDDAAASSRSTAPRNTCTTVDPMKAEQWVYSTRDGEPAGHVAAKSAMNFQFTTPQNVPADQRCGKVVFSDMHVSADSGSAPGVAVPERLLDRPADPAGEGAGVHVLRHRVVRRLHLLM